MQKQSKPRKIRMPQRQHPPGKQYKMNPPPVTEPLFPGSGKLYGKVALITGGDSGIGRAVAELFASEGAKVSFAYLNEDEDAAETQRLVQQHSECLSLRADLSHEKQCKKVVSATVKRFKRIDILVNNAGRQFEAESIEKIPTDQLLTTFETNFFSYFWMSRYALRYIPEGGCIINTTSVTAYRGSQNLIDYSSTKGAIVSFTRSLSSNLSKRKIRVNAVAPGPVWTPLIVSSFAPEKTEKFGSEVPMERAAQPAEIAPSYLFLASNDSCYMSGQVLHPNGGEVVNG
jgi:NAD(P)-dependent dehydrogenase (short-subunit alcohol dehydrogenase family)